MTIPCKHNKKATAYPFQALDFSSAFDTLSLFRSGPQTSFSCDIGSAQFTLDWDISPLFPYINAVAQKAQYFERPDYIRFSFQNRLCAFYPRNGAFTPVGDMADAAEFLSELAKFIFGIRDKYQDITPNYKRFKPASPVDIFRLLPATNCRQCGYATCVAFAAALARNHTTLVECPHLANPVQEKAEFPIYDSTGNCIRIISFSIHNAYC